MSKEQLSTSKKEVPKHKNALEEKYKEQQVESVEETKRVDETNVSDIKNELPQPTGWRILVMPYKGREKTDGGIHLPDAVRDREALATVVAYVLKVGPLAYKDQDKFGDGEPWCKEGDWICIGRYSGSRFRIEGGEVRIINDDEVIATIVDPEDIQHI